MAGKRFKITASAMMLLMYLMVMVVGNVSLMVCDCHLHAHHHSAGSEHHTCCCGGCHALVFSDRFNSTVDSKCGCLHDHSTDVELYTASRSSVDDLSERNVILSALLSEPLYGKESIADSGIEHEYSLYLLPPLSSAIKGCESLRAPPAMV